MPKWLKIVIEMAVIWLKRTGKIDPNVDKKPETPNAEPAPTTKDVRRNSIHNRDKT